MKKKYKVVIYPHPATKTKQIKVLDEFGDLYCKYELPSSWSELSDKEIISTMKKYNWYSHQYGSTTTYYLGELKNDDNRD